MAKGNRCYLCGGRLSRGRCTLCGLDNDRMTKRDYRLNVTTPYHVKKQQVAARKAENMKYIKAYEARQESLENMGKPLNQQQRTRPPRPIDTPTKSNTGRTDYQKQTADAYKKLQNEMNARVGKRNQDANRSRKNWKGASILGIIWVIILVISEVGGCIEELVSDFSYASPEYTDEFYVEEEVSAEPFGAAEEDDYAYVTRELSETGAYYESELGPGNYIVGVHIPEGKYTMEIVDGTYVSAYIQDAENSIYISPSFGEDSFDGYLSMEDIRLYKDAYVEVYGAGTIRFTSENAQVDAMTGMDNPMDPDAVATFSAVESKELTIGEDIPAGVYDLSALTGWTSVCVSYHEDEEDSVDAYYWVDADTAEHTYRNIVLIDGMTVTFDNCEIQFAPSDWIVTDDYEAYFMDYLYS